MGQPAALLRAPSGLDLAILAPRSPASRRAKGSRKSASGRSLSTARSRATRRAVSETLRIRPSSDGAAVDSEGALLRSGSCMRGPYIWANRIAGIFGLSHRAEELYTRSPSSAPNSCEATQRAVAAKERAEAARIKSERNWLRPRPET